MVDMLSCCYLVLRIINWMVLVGCWLLVQMLGVSEWMLWIEMDILWKLDLIMINKLGM